MSRHQKTPSGNIKSVIALEENDRRQHSAAERAFHAIGHSVGTIWFVILQGLWIGSWVIWNISQPAYFDPYPFSLLSVILTIEAVFLASFVLMNQNAADLQAERRNHLDLQINLLAEQEATTALNILLRIAAHLQIDLSDNERLNELSKDTRVEKIAHDLRSHEK